MKITPSKKKKKESNEVVKKLENEVMEKLSK